MSHFDAVRPNGTWGDNMVPNQADVQRWDVTQNASVNGDLGGGYAPTSPIIIGGSGISLGANGFIGGGVTTTLGGSITVSSASFDFPSFSSTRSRFLTIPFEPLVPVGDTVLNVNSIYVPIPPRSLHDRAVFGQLTIWYRFLQKPTVLTIPPPYIAVLPFRFDGFQDATSPGPLNPSSGVLEWSAGTPYAVGQYILPSTILTQNNRYFRCTVAGTSALPEPNWPTTFGTTVTDGGGVSWICVGRSGSLGLLGSSPDSLFNKGQPQAFILDFDTSVVTPNTVDINSHHYVIKIANVPPIANPLLPQQGNIYAIQILSININYVLIGNMHFQ